MQQNVFVENLARPATLTSPGDRAVARVTLIANEYVVKDRENCNARECSVAIQFTAFRQKAEAIVKNVLKGDQLIVDYRIENNDYEEAGETVYGYNFIVENFAFGALSKEKREQFSRAGE
jgi:single-strand DNA-binding protein